VRAVAIVVLVLWALTGGVGVFLLRAVIAAQHAGSRPPGSTVPDVRAQDAHPLLEFAHPALGVVGLGFWFMFVATHYHRFAWIAVGVLAATVLAGACWLAVNARSRSRGGRPGLFRQAPLRLILLHGLAALATAALAVTASVTLGH
jgi:hypothetical protein